MGTIEYPPSVPKWRISIVVQIFILRSVIPILFFSFFILISYGERNRKRNPDSYYICLRLPPTIQKMLHPFGKSLKTPLYVFINSITCLLCGAIFLGINIWNSFFSCVDIASQQQFYQVFIPVIFSVYIIGMILIFCSTLVWTIKKREFIVFSCTAFFLSIIVLMLLIFFICHSIPILKTLIN